MVELQKVTVRYGERTLLDEVSLHIPSRAHWGLVGANGSGKTTLLRIIAGVQSPDKGHISKPKELRIGYLQQIQNTRPDQTALASAMEAWGDLRRLQRRQCEIERALEGITDYQSSEYNALLEELALVHDRIHLLDSGKLEGKAVKVLRGLGFHDEMMHQPIEQLSGGWRMRVELAKLLLQQPGLLLLDEPSNYLDVESLIWLEGYLREYSGAFVVVSHDCDFLNGVARGIIELRQGKLFRYTGNYDDYLQQREQQFRTLEAQYVHQQREIARKERLIERFRAKATKAKMAQSLIKELQRMERIELPEVSTKSIRLRFMQVPRSGEWVVRVRNVGKRFGAKVVLDGVEFDVRRGEKWAFVGQNGRGKTTLMRIIAGELAPDTGEVLLGHRVIPQYFAQEEARTLPEDQTVLEYAEAHAEESLRPFVRTVLGALLFSGEDVDKKIAVLSGGERTRLALARLALSTSNLLLLDEPTNHLDIPARDVLKDALQNYPGTILIVSHDRHFLDGWLDRILYFGDQGIRQYDGHLEHFLEASGLQRLRDAGISQGRDASTPSQPARGRAKKSQSAHQRELQKRLRAVERKIEKLETRIHQLEQRMAEPEAYLSDDYPEVVEQYQRSKEELQVLLSEWERIAETLEG